MTPDDLAQAAADAEADLAALVDLDDNQLYYLANLHMVEDPLSDGIEHDHEEPV